MNKIVITNIRSALLQIIRDIDNDFDFADKYADVKKDINSLLSELSKQFILCDYGDINSVEINRWRNKNFDIGHSASENQCLPFKDLLNTRINGIREQINSIYNTEILYSIPDSFYCRRRTIPLSKKIIDIIFKYCLSYNDFDILDKLYHILDTYFTSIQIEKSYYIWDDIYLGEKLNITQMILHARVKLKMKSNDDIAKYINQYKWNSCHIEDEENDLLSDDEKCELNEFLSEFDSE